MSIITIIGMVLACWAMLSLFGTERQRSIADCRRRLLNDSGDAPEAQPATPAKPAAPAKAHTPPAPPPAAPPAPAAKAPPQKAATTKEIAAKAR